MSVRACVVSKVINANPPDLHSGQVEIIKALKIKEITMIIKEITTLPMEIPRKS